MISYVTLLAGSSIIAYLYEHKQNVRKCVCRVYSQVTVTERNLLLLLRMCGRVNSNQFITTFELGKACDLKSNFLNKFNDFFLRESY